MINFNLGDKVNLGEIVGYIVKVEINPLSPYERFNELDNPVYTIRAFTNWWKDGYYDFKRTKNDIKKID